MLDLDRFIYEQEKEGMRKNDFRTLLILPLKKGSAQTNVETNAALFGFCLAHQLVEG